MLLINHTSLIILASFFSIYFNERLFCFHHSSPSASTSPHLLPSIAFSLHSVVLAPVDIGNVDVAALWVLLILVKVARGGGVSIIRSTLWDQDNWSALRRHLLALHEILQSVGSVVWHVPVEASVVTGISGTAKNVDALVVQLNLDSLGSLTGVDVDVIKVRSGNIGRVEAISEYNGLWVWLDIRKLHGWQTR